MICCQRIAQQFVGDVRIDFRCAHASVAEHLLYGKQVGTAFEQVGGEAVSKSMRADDFVDAILLGEFFYDKENHLPCEACASAVQENCIGKFRFWCDV